MTDTARTLSYLYSSEFVDGQMAGSITPQRVRDLIATLGARTPFTIATQPEYGADPIGSADSTSQIQAAMTAAAGGICLLPMGNFRVSATIVMPANTIFIGSGYGTRIYTTSGSGFNFVNNANFSATYSASTKVDSNIRVEGIFFDYGALNDGSTHAVSFRMAQNITVRDCFFSGGNNCTAMLACISTLVENCHTPIGATGLSNAAYDHWDGAQDFTVRGCSAALASAANGCLCTGTGTVGNEVRTTTNGTFEDCYFYGGGGYGVLANAGASGCVVSNIHIRNIKLNGTAGGVAFQGAGGQHTIDGIWWESGGSSGSGGCAVFCQTDTSGGPPNDCSFDKINIVGSTTQSANVGMLQIGGLRHTIGAIHFITAAIASGTAFYFPTNSNGSVILGPITADASSISNITFGLYQDSSGAFGAQTTLACWDPFNSYYRNEGPGEINYRNNVDIFANQGLHFTNQTSGPGAGAGTLTNAPSAGNPAFWVPITVNGVTRHFPVW